LAEQGSEREFVGLDEAVIEMRVIGHCAMCDRIVERADDGSCPEGHPAEAVTGRVLLGPHDDVPVLPRFNLAAFLIPPIWGPAHGQWVGAIFLPMWLFVDSIIGSAGAGGMATRVASYLVIATTLAFQAFFAKRANGLVWRRIADRTTVADFAKRQLIWAVASVPAAAIIVGWAVWFHMTHAVGAR
jgi:hypothetical protein